MSDTSRGAAATLTEERTNRMILLISIGIVFTLTVGGFCIAANSLGGQNEGLLDSQQTVLDSFDLVETAQLDSEREIDFVLGSYTPAHSILSFSKSMNLSPNGNTTTSNQVNTVTNSKHSQN